MNGKMAQWKAPTGRDNIAYGFNHRKQKVPTADNKPCKGDITLNEATYNNMPPLQGLNTNDAVNVPMVETIGYDMPPRCGYPYRSGNITLHKTPYKGYVCTPYKGYERTPCKGYQDTPYKGCWNTPVE